MTTAVMYKQQNSGYFSVIVLVLVIIAAFAAVSLHALAKHGVDAVTASQCADYPEARLVNPITGRIAFVCLTDRGWGVAIFEADMTPVTSFIKEKARTIEHVIRYLMNVGYRP